MVLAHRILIALDGIIDERAAGTYGDVAGREVVDALGPTSRARANFI